MEDIESFEGLSDQQADKLRPAAGKDQRMKKMTKSYRYILLENIFSVFNIINVAIAAALFYVGSAKNCLFMIAVVSNTMIGIIQEIRSKRVIDRLSIISQPTVTLIRSGRKREADLSELVTGDLIELKGGCQVPNDCLILSGGCDVNEALLTGESDPIYKRKGDSLMSGSFLTGGSCVCEITAVGSENYADSLLSEIKYVKGSNSEIVRVIKRIISVITAVIVPLGLMLFMNQVSQPGSSVRESVESTAAALIGMIPEGLVLLVSTVFALGVIRLSKHEVLSQDLYSLESLARADVLCLDKTGTVTTGEMTVEKAVPAEGVDSERLHNIISEFAAFSPDDNATVKAVRVFCKDSAADRSQLLSVRPFSSDRKWSAVSTKDHGTIIVGSAEMIFGGKPDFSALTGIDSDSFRILAVAESSNEIIDKKLPDNITLVGYILLKEELREGIDETFRFFEAQGVELKLISGDNPETVRRLCENVFNEKVSCVDMSALSDEDIPDIAESGRIFGRATPAQKKLLIAAMKKAGHTVAMAGDGVNDVLALKESDCSIAPAQGSSAARNVSQLVLLDSDFRSLPSVVAEGRRSVNNLQSSSALFLTKTIFSAVMALIFIFADLEYPLEPIQMTLISTLTIGFPSFILSFIKNTDIIKGSFLHNVIKNSLPAAIANIISVMTAVIFGAAHELGEAEISSLCMAALAVTGITLIIKIYRPLTPIRLFVVLTAAAGFIAAFGLFPSFFGITHVFVNIDMYMVIISIFDFVVLCILLITFSKVTE